MQMTMYPLVEYHVMHYTWLRKGALPCSVVSLRRKQPFHQRTTRSREMEIITARTIPTIAPADRPFWCSDGIGKSEESRWRKYINVVNVLCWKRKKLLHHLFSKRTRAKWYISNELSKDHLFPITTERWTSNSQIKSFLHLSSGTLAICQKC